MAAATENEVVRLRSAILAAGLAASFFLSPLVSQGPFVRSARADGTTPGSVVVLSGTTHIWVADDDGSFHWAGDTRALAAHRVNWDVRREVSLSELLELPRGAPWLSSGLLKIGDPVYLVKWESADPMPTLAQVRSIRDIEVFGVDAANWGTLVYDAPLWERRFGLSTSRLTRTVLEPAVAAPAIASPPATAAYTPAAPTPAPVLTTPIGGATPLASAAATTPAPTSDTYRLNRTPLVRADGDFPLGAGESWADGIAIDDRDYCPDVPYSSHVLAQWTIGSGASAAYVRVVSVNLDYNKDVTTIETLAKKVFETYCRGISKCEGTTASVSSLIVAGMPALRYDTRTRVEYWATPSGGSGSELVQHDWIATHVLFLRGEWGYEVRIFSEQPSTAAARIGDALGSLAKVQFRKP